MSAKIVPLGVGIIDRDGSQLAGITEEDALHLLAALAKLAPKILRRLPNADDILF